MLEAILTWSLRNRAAVLALWVGIAGFGLWSAAHLRLDAFPDTSPVMVQVHATSEALSPLEMEQQVTRPLEGVLSGLPHLEELRSVSKFGLTQLTLVFEDGTDPWFSRQVISERLRQVALPEGVEGPTLGPQATGLGEIFHYLLFDPTRSLAELRTLHDTLVAPWLRTVRGVAEVNAWGGHEREIQVIVDLQRLRSFEIGLGELQTALLSNNLQVSGGVQTRGGSASLVSGQATLRSLDDLASVVLRSRDGAPLTLGDVARVEEGHALRHGAVTAGARGEVVLGLGFALADADSFAVTHGLQSALTEIKKRLPAGVSLEPVYQRTEVISAVLATVRKNLLEGALLVVAVLFAFLGRLRAGLIVASAIPLSMCFAATLMAKAGIAGSLMSLGALDFGLIVDSSVIQVENVVRRARGDREGFADRVRDAVLEVRKPTLFGELIIAAVYLPVLALEGIEGKLFRPMALTVLFALLGSVLLSLTLIPVLCSLGLGATAGHSDTALSRGLLRLYRPLVRASLAHPAWVLALGLAALAGGAVASVGLGTELVPRLYEGAIVINKVQLAGVSLEESVRTSARIEHRLLQTFPDEIDRVWSRTGSAEIATDPMGVELSDLFVMLRPREQWKRASTQTALVDAMRESLSSIPGVRLSFSQPIELRISEMGAGIREDVGVRIFGDDMEVLESAAAKVQAVLAAVPGAADVGTEPMTGQPVLELRLDRDAAARRGVSAEAAMLPVAARLGLPSGHLREGLRPVPIAVRLDPKHTRDKEALLALAVNNAAGQTFELAEVADAVEDTQPTNIAREQGLRRALVSANVQGRDLGGFVADLRQRLDEQIALPAGYFLEIAGRYQHLQRAEARLKIVVPTALGLVAALLWLTYRRFRDCLRVLAGVPFAALGGVLALRLAEMPLTVSAAIGFVVLCGVSVLGDMVLVSTVRQRLAEGIALPEAVQGAAETRLRPVLMTALVASLGFLPMVLNTGFGAEVQRPLATVVIGGIASSTLLTLLVLPALYVWTSRSASGSAVIATGGPTTEA